MDERWRFTTVRVPRWLADQLRDRARVQGLAEVWEGLLVLEDVTPPTPLPPRYAHLVANVAPPGPRAALPPVRVPESLTADGVAAALDAARVAYVRTADGFLPASATNARTPREWETAEHDYKALTARVFALANRARAGG